MKKCNKLTVNDIEMLNLLMEKGLSSTESAKVFKGGASTVKRYYAILRAIRNGDTIPIPFEQYNRRIIEQFCENHGYEFKPMQETPMQEEVRDSDAPKIEDLVKALDLISHQLLDITEVFCIQIHAIFALLAGEVRSGEK